MAEAIEVFQGATVLLFQFDPSLYIRFEYPLDRDVFWLFVRRVYYSYNPMKACLPSSSLI
jgi:hypothetical protein